MHLMISLILLVPALLKASPEIRDVVIDGDGLASVRFQCQGCLEKEAKLTIDKNQIEVSWVNATLSEKHKGKAEWINPHPLLGRVSLFAIDKIGVKAVLTLRGSVDELQQRVHMSQGSDGARLQIAFPNGTSQALALLRQEEEIPLKTESSIQKALVPKFGMLQILGFLSVIVLAGATSIIGSRWLKKKGKLGGSRKFLIEKVSQIPLDHKASVCLIKVGEELLLVGVTNAQVTFLSALPRLQEQYDSESRLERRAFRDAVDDEFRRIKQSPLAA